MPSCSLSLTWGQPPDWAADARQGSASATTRKTFRLSLGPKTPGLRGERLACRSAVKT